MNINFILIVPNPKPRSNFPPYINKRTWNMAIQRNLHCMYNIKVSISISIHVCPGVRYKELKKNVDQTVFLSRLYLNDKISQMFKGTAYLELAMSFGLHFFWLNLYHSLCKWAQMVLVSGTGVWRSKSPSIFTSSP